MAKMRWWMCIFLAFYLSHCEVFSTSSRLFDSIFNEAEPCKESCDKTYPLHTYPNPRHAECCKRGCRFYSLVELINKSQDENATKDVCMASCMEAYSSTSDRYACNIGCSNQIPFSTPSSLDINDDDVMVNEEWPTLPLLKPFMYVSNVYNNMVDRMSKMMSISWSFYMQRDDGQIVVIQSKPEILTEFADVDDAEDKGKDDDVLSENGELTGIKMDRNRDPSDQSFGPLSNSNSPLSDIFFYHRQLSPDGVANENLPVRITVNAYATEEIKSLDWLGCVSRKSGLPRWLLGFVIFVSAMVMVWLCFATTATAPEQHIKSQALSIYGDGECVKLEKDELRVKEYLDDKEALLQPVKVHRPTV